MAKTAKEILEKAIQKAIDGGWTAWGFDAKNLMQDCMGSGGESSTQEVIFNHDFAKALWGDSPVHNMGGAVGYVTNWQYHLQQMVVADDPIKYLEENI